MVISEASAGKKCIFSFGAKQKGQIHTIDGCLKYLKGGKLPKVSQTLTMFAGDDEVGKFDFQDYDDSNGDDYGDNDDDDEDDFFW